MKNTAGRIAAALALGASQIATAATQQSFLFYGQSGTSPWSDKNSWKYNNGSNSGSWVTPSGAPDGFSYDVYFRSPMTVKNGSTNKTQSYNPSWNHVVTFSGAQKVGATQQPLHLDAGSSAENPIVFTATQSDYGLTSSSTLNIAETADGYLQIDSGTYSFGHVVLANGSGKTGVLTMNGGTLKILNDYARIGCGGGTGILTVKTGAVFDNSEASNKNFTLGQDANSSGTLNVEGGEVTVKGYLAINYDSGSTGSALNVTDGGLLSIGRILFRNNGGSGAGTITIDNGTIKALNDHTSFIPAHNDLTLYVGNGGATFDTDSHDITIAEPLTAVANTSGGLTVTGGGSATFTAGGNLTGAFAIGDGTTLRYFDQDGTVADYGMVSLSIGAGATIYLDANATGCDTFTAATTNISATAENPATIELVFSAVPAAGRKFALFETDSAAKFNVNPKLGVLTLPHEVAVEDGVLTLTITADDYAWNGTGTNWGDAGAWTKNAAAADWSDGNNAIFDTAGRTAILAADVSAAEVRFTANATIATNATDEAALTIASAKVDVAAGANGTISAPVAGPLEKTGAGTLTLSQSRTGVATVLSEGTLAMSGTASLDWSQFTFGTDAEKPVALHMGANATIANIPQNWRIGNVEGLASAFVKDGGDLTVGNIYLSGKTGADTSFIQNGGLLSVGGGIDIGSVSEAHFEIAGGTVTNTANYIHMSPNSSPADMTVRTGAKYGMSANDYGLIVSGRSHGTLNVSGGDVFANGPLNLCYRGGDATVNVTDGGVLTFDKVQYNGGAESDPKGGAAVISIDGGTVRANASDSAFIPGENNLTVTVGANCGTLDANGKNVTVAKAIGGTGGMTYKGGGSVVLSVQPAYSGVTTVEVGTTLSVPSPIAGADLAFAIPGGLASGLYKVVAVSGDGAFASDALSTATLPSGLNAHFSLENGGKEIWCIYSNADNQHVWIGGASGSLNDAANWLSGAVPAGGTAIIGNPSAAELSNPEGSAFAATTIIVPDGSAPVTISGAAFSGITKIENYSTSQIEFLNAVTFSANVNVIQSPGIVKFTGGATGTKLGAATAIHGTYNFTATGDLTEIGGTTVKSDGVYKLLGGTFYKHNGDFDIEAGGKVEVGAAKINRSSEAKLLDVFNGEFKVNGEFYVSASGANSYITHYIASSGAGTFIVNRIRVITYAALVPRRKTIVGGGGIIRGNGYVRVYNSGTHEFGSYADWTMYHDNLGNTATDSPAFYKHNSTTLSTLTFNTTDYYDSTVARLITCEAPIAAQNSSSANNFAVTVNGIGKFVFANTSNGTTQGDYPTYIFSGGLTVNDSATIEVKANAWPGKGAVTLNGTSTLLLHTGGAARTGAITVNNGTTLEVAETSGTASLGGALTLNQGSKLKFKLAENGNATLSLTALTLNATAENKALVEFAAGSVKSYGRSYTLTSGGKFSEGDEAKFALPERDGGRLTVEGGNLVYTAPEYFHIKIAESSLSDLEVPLSWVCGNTAVDGASSATEIETALKSTGANGIPVWQSYCLGLNPNIAASVVLCDSAETQPSDGTVKIAAKNLNVPEGLSGVTVKARLYRRKNGGGWEAVGDDVTVSSGTAVLASPTLGEGTSFFQIRVVLDPV